MNISRGKLPHWQIGGSWYFVTFRANTPLSPQARTIVAECILYHHQRKYDLGIASVMPDHVHILLRPRPWRSAPMQGKIASPTDSNSGADESYFTLTEILRSIKGIAGRKINLLNKRTGSIWQKESFDRIVRDENEWLEKYQYVRNNAIKAGLTERPEEYPWLLERDDFIKRF